MYRMHHRVQAPRLCFTASLLILRQRHNKSKQQKETHSCTGGIVGRRLNLCQLPTSFCEHPWLMYREKDEKRVSNASSKSETLNMNISTSRYMSVALRSVTQVQPEQDLPLPSSWLTGTVSAVEADTDVGTELRVDLALSFSCWLPLKSSFSVFISNNDITHQNILMPGWALSRSFRKAHRTPWLCLKYKSTCG